MIRKVLSVIVTVITIFLYISTAFPCTSFVIHSDRIYYGMNFDWPDTEMRFCIEKNSSIKYFHFQFYKYDHFSTTVGMNTSGVFCSIQMLYPEDNFQIPEGLNLWEAFMLVVPNFDDLTLFTNYLDQTGRRIIHVPNASLHNLFADIYEHGFVLEVGENENQLTQIKDSILVMTNFHNYQFSGQNYTQVYGTGADRYKAAYQSLLACRDSFTVDDGFDVLQNSIQPSTSEYPTQCSMIYDPQDTVVYIALRSNFNKIWKLSLEQETVETWKGFDKYDSIKIGNAGILDSQLPDDLSGIDPACLMPEEIILFQNYPNPFNPATTICYSLPQAACASLEIYNILGKKVVTLIEEYQQAGKHQLKWQADGLPSGIYLARLKAGSQMKKIKLVLQK